VKDYSSLADSVLSKDYCPKEQIQIKKAEIQECGFKSAKDSMKGTMFQPASTFKATSKESSQAEVSTSMEVESDQLCPLPHSQTSLHSQKLESLHKILLLVKQAREQDRSIQLQDLKMVRTYVANSEEF
jgi:hypothetical protein